GQIAHLDRDSSNSSRENLAFMCLEHHGKYDSTAPQHKGLTAAEAKAYLAILHTRVAEGNLGPDVAQEKAVVSSIVAGIYASGPGAIQLSGQNALVIHGGVQINTVVPAQTNPRGRQIFSLAVEIIQNSYGEMFYTNGAQSALPGVFWYRQEP